MFSALPREIVWKILDLYADTIGAGYLSLRPVNKQICTYIDGTARNYIRGHCYMNKSYRVTDHSAFISEMHTGLLKYMSPCTNVRFEHKYLPIIVSITTSSSVHHSHYGRDSFRIGGCYIYVGKSVTVFDIRATMDKVDMPASVTAMHIRYGLGYSRYPGALDFIGKYFTELYGYLTTPHLA
jgi:hypothetical protein